MTDFQTLTTHIATAAREAGAFILQERKAFTRDAIEYKGTNNLVSYVDKTAEEMIVARLAKLLPEARFITEEDTTKTVPDESALNWIIDPLDGTSNFIHGLPVFSVSIGLAEGKTPLAGVVYDINRDESFTAWKGGGAFCNDVPIHVSPAKSLSESLLSTGFPYYKFDQIGQYLKILETLMQGTHGLRRMGSAAIDLANVACGRFEAFYEFNLNSWDMAAGVLLVQEAGGIVTDFEGGNEFLFRGDVIAGCAVQPELLSVIQKYWL